MAPVSAMQGEMIASQSQSYLPQEKI